jgi:hypothetical protein
MSVAEAVAYLDTWAAKQNERHSARQNLLKLVEAFRVYIEDGEENPDQLDRDLLNKRLAEMASGKRRNDPRRGRTKVPVAVVLAAFDEQRQYCASDTEAARRVARLKLRAFPGGADLKVSRNTVLRRVKERRRARK